MKRYDTHGTVDEEGQFVTFIDCQQAVRAIEQRLAAVNQFVKTGLSANGRQFYGTQDDIVWLQEVLLDYSD